MTYLLTRRCSERRFFLLPDPIVRQIFEYLLGMLAAQYSIEIHAYVVMSNHYHLVVTDTKGVVPDFQRDLNSMLARAINRHRWRTEAVWDRNSYNGVELLDQGDVISKMAYTLANPVKARLVDRATDWEGASSVDMGFGRARRIARPKKFFRKSMPEEVELVLTRPKGCKELSDSQVRELVREDVARREGEHAREGRAMGMKNVRAQDWRSSPETVEEPGQLRPTVSGSMWAKIEVLRQSKDWLRAYYGALADFVAGRRDVEFPPGTWQMCVRLGCRVAAAAPQ